ncbi:hypothetical protein R6Q57_010151 [Mikania cordata]
MEEMVDEDDMQFEEEEFDFNENTSNGDDDEMDFSDHSSDEDAFDWGCCIYRGGYTGHPPNGTGSSNRGGMGDPMGDMQGVLREHAYHEHMQTLVDHEDDDYEKELGDIDGNEDGDDDGDDIDYHDMHDSMSIDDASHASQKPFISRIGDVYVLNFSILIYVV